MKLDRFALPVSAALAGIISFTMLGLLHNGTYFIAALVRGEPYMWAFWQSTCGRVAGPVVYAIITAITVGSGVVGYRMLWSHTRAGLRSARVIIGLALLMLPLWDILPVIGWSVYYITGRSYAALFPFAGGESALLGLSLLGSSQIVQIPLVLVFTVMLVKVIKMMLPEDSGWVRSIATAAALGASW